MAWTAPMTAVANTVFTAAQFNTHVRDNLNETGPAKATGTGSFIVTSGLNSISQRTPSTARTDTAETTTSTSFTDLATVGPSVTVTLGNRAIVGLTCRFNNTTASQPGLMGYDISGATSFSAVDSRSLWHETSGTGEFNRSSIVSLHTGLTGGSNTFTSKYRVGGGTGEFQYREMFVIPL